MGRHRLVVADVERSRSTGRSLRLFVSRADRAARGASVRRLLADEAAAGVDRRGFYEEFARRVERLRASLREMLGSLKRQGHRLAVYGAAAKGMTLLNSCGIGADLLEFVVDRSVHDQGRLVPGVRLPIHAPEMLLARMPDYVLRLSWNFADEILEQQAEYRRRGGRFIIPVPEPRVV